MMYASYRWCLWLMAWLSVWCVVPLAAQNAPQDETAKPVAAVQIPSLSIEKFVLANGLQVILHVDRKLPVVHVNQWFHVGSKDERVGRSGFAHLFEHLMFQGSQNAPGEYFSYLEQIGGRGTNGTTSWDRTNYFATVPAGNLEYLLWLESDRLATFLQALTQDKLDNQREVVKNERRQRQENQPYGRWRTLMFENLYPYRHPYANDVIGSHEDLSAAALDDVRDFFSTYYTPNNLSLSIVGDFDPAEAKQLVTKYFGGLQTGPTLDRVVRGMPQLAAETIVEVQDRVPQERVYISWHSPAFFDPGDAELNLASLILAEGLSSRLQKVLVYEQQLCSELQAFQWSREIGGNFVVTATARPGVGLARIEQMITAEIAKLADEGPTSDELQRAQTSWEYTFVTGLERIGGFSGKADRLNHYNTHLGDPDKFEADIRRYSQVTVDGVRSAVGRWLDTQNRVLIRFHPEAAERADAPAVDRSTPPALGPPVPFQVPEVQTAQLDNGLEVFVVERPDLPKVAVQLATRAGSVHDPAGKAGLADLTAVTMARGTPTRSALVIEETLSALGTSLNGAASREYASLSFEVLSRHLPAALEIFADVARNPMFPAAEVERERSKRLDALAREAQEPNAIAYRVSQMLAFGADHPYGRSVRGLRQTIRALFPRDFIQLHQRHWTPGGAVLIFVGAISLDAATQLAQEHFGTWTGEAQVAPPVPQSQPTEPAEPAHIYLVDRQGAAQTVVMQILPGLARSDDAYYALRLADSVWGGKFGARLNMNLREEKGYSYGVYSLLTSYSQAGLWRASGGVQADKTAESVVEFVKELRLLVGEKPVTQAELANVKAFRIRGYAQEFESLQSIGQKLIQLWGAGVPIAELQHEPGKTEHASLEAVHAAVQSHAIPERAIVLLVGDREKIEAGVRALNLGTLVVLDAEGKHVTPDE